MIGLDVSDRSIKVIDLTDGARRKIRTACWSPLDVNLMRRGVIQDSAGVVTAIQEALTKCSAGAVRERRAVISIPEAQSFVRALELPTMTNRELNEAVQWAIRQHIPFDLDRMYLDWQPIPVLAGEEERQEVLVGAVQREVVDPLLEVIDAVGLQVIALEVEAQAIVRALLPPDSYDITGVLIIDIGATSTNIIFFDRGSIRFTTSLQRGGDDLTQVLAQKLNIDPREAAEKKALVGVSGGDDQEVVAVLQSATLSLIQQAGQLVHEVTAKESISQGVKAIMLSGGSSNLPGIVDVFAQVFPGVPVQVGNPLINLLYSVEEKNSPLSVNDATHFTTAIGLALRRVELGS